MSAQDELLHAISVISDSFGDKFDAENFKEMVSLTKAYYQDRRYFRSLVAARDEERKGRTHLIKSVRSGNITWAKKLLELLDDIDNYTVESTQFLGKECYICYEQFEENQIVYKVPCRGQHIFHKECIDKWVNINSSCPYCRDPISLEDITGYINKSSQTDKNVLYYAIKVGNLPFVEQLIQKGAMIQYRNASPLHLAAGFSHNDLITYFLAKGHNIEKTDGYGNTPLYYAASYAKPSTLKCLLDNSANYMFSYYNERTDSKQENTMLHVAVKQPNKEALPFILDFFKQKNLSIDMKDSEHHTPLYIAIQQRYNDIVVELVEAGADLTSLDENHPLYPSLKAHFYDDDDDDEYDTTKHTIFGYLLQKTEEAFKENFQAYQTFLSGVLKEACKIHEMDHAKYLLRKYQNVEIDKECFSALCCSRATEYFSKHKLLDRLFEYPEFFLACVKADNREVVKAYIERKNNMNSKDEKGNTALHLAKYLEMFELIIDLCDIHATNNEGETPLHSYLGSVSLSDRKPLSYEDSFKDIFQEEEEEEEEEDEDYVAPPPRRVPLDNDEEEEPIPVPIVRRPVSVTATKKVVSKVKYIPKPRADIIDLLLKRGVDLHAKTKKGLTAFQVACHFTDSYNFSLVLRLLDSGVDINECSTYQAPLHIAMLNENAPLIKELVRRGADIHRTFDEETILHYAVHKQDMELLKLLFEKGIDVNLKNRRGETALWHAFCKAGLKEDELCAFLIEKGAVLKDSIQGNVSKLLFQAVQSGSLKTVKMLIEMGADIHVENEWNQTPLQKCHLYKQSGREIAEFLLSLGADINKKDDEGICSLFLSAPDDEESVKFLVEHGADVHTKDKSGWTPLYMAVGNTPPDTNTDDTASNEIVERQKRIVKLLLEKGANVNERDNKGETSIFNCPNIQMLKYLVEQGADMNATDLSGRTVLFEKIVSINSETFRMYMNLGVDINKQDNRGYTLLHEAIVKKHESSLIGGCIFVDYLMSHGADPLLKTKEGLTAIDLAVQLGKHTLVDRLKKKDEFLTDVSSGYTRWFMNRVAELTFHVVSLYPEGTPEEDTDGVDVEIHDLVRQYMPEEVVEHYIHHVLETPERARHILVLKIEQLPFYLDSIAE